MPAAIVFRIHGGQNQEKQFIKREREAVHLLAEFIRKANNGANLAGV